MHEVHPFCMPAAEHLIQMQYCNLNRLQEAILRCKEVKTPCDSQQLLILGMLGINTSSTSANWTLIFSVCSTHRKDNFSS